MKTKAVKPTKNKVTAIHLESAEKLLCTTEKVLLNLLCAVKGLTDAPLFENPEHDVRLAKAERAGLKLLGITPEKRALRAVK